MDLYYLYCYKNDLLFYFFSIWKKLNIEKKGNSLESKES